jgi:hypothetical protein
MDDVLSMTTQAASECAPAANRYKYLIAGNDHALKHFNRVCRGSVSSLMRLKGGKRSALDICRGSRKAQVADPKPRYPRENCKCSIKGRNARRATAKDAQPSQRRSFHLKSWQVFAAPSRSSADQFRVGSPWVSSISLSG